MNMPSNLDRYKNELDTLIDKGDKLLIAMLEECGQLDSQTKKKLRDIRKSLPPFRGHYQHWYSEAKVLVKQVLPDRLEDFVGHYENPKRKQLSAESYRIADYLQGLGATRGEGAYERKI